MSIGYKVVGARVIIKLDLTILCLYYFSIIMYCTI
jgi:hypothetical protein